MNKQAQLCLQEIKGIGPKRSETIANKLTELNKSLDDLFSMSAAEIKERFRLPVNVAEAIASATKTEMKAEFVPEIDVFSEKGIKILKRGTPEYPKRLEQMLGDKAPPELYVWGNTALFDKPAVGFCGSREASDKSIGIAHDTAQQIADAGWVVVSGHAKGVDTAAHRAALEGGGGTIIVVPQGILDFKLRRELKSIARPEQILIVSQFPPESGWTVGRAMSRNSTIIGLSDAMVLVAARNKGGTFEAGKTALRMKMPLFVAKYSDDEENVGGNTYFLQRGAYKLQQKEDTAKPNIDYLREIVERKIAAKSETSEDVPDEKKPQQLSLIPE